jgi:hypothetical protein
MEILLALVVFGLMAAFTIYGYTRAQAASRARERGDFSRGDAFAMVAGNDTRADTPTSPDPKKTD